MYYIKDSNGFTIKSCYFDFIALKCKKTTFIIRTHQISHFLLFLDHHWILIINDEDVEFAVLCGLNIEKLPQDYNNLVPKRMNCLF